MYVYAQLFQKLIISSNCSSSDTKRAFEFMCTKLVALKHFCPCGPFTPPMWTNMVFSETPPPPLCPHGLWKTPKKKKWRDCLYFWSYNMPWVCYQKCQIKSRFSNNPAKKTLIVNSTFSFCLWQKFHLAFFELTPQLERILEIPNPKSLANRCSHYKKRKCHDAAKPLFFFVLAVPDDNN